MSGCLWDKPLGMAEWELKLAALLTPVSSLPGIVPSAALSAVVVGHVVELTACD